MAKSIKLLVPIRSHGQKREFKSGRWVAIAKDRFGSWILASSMGDWAVLSDAHRNIITEALRIIDEQVTSDSAG